MEAPTGASLRPLLDWQNADGSWPTVVGDMESSWTTSLALVTVSVSGGPRKAIDRAVRSLVESRGREAHWLWRWKFKTIDRQVRIDPDKFGWPWIPGTTSWALSTAFAVIALKQFTACNHPHIADSIIRTSIEMSLDR